MASLEKTSDGYLLVQQNCPASCVAARHPQIICTAEIGFIRRVLGATVERVCWIQKGDSTCSYHIRANDVDRPNGHSPLTEPASPTFRPAPAE
jgi:predicted ArsR family transcriptional regulator